MLTSIFLLTGKGVPQTTTTKYIVCVCPNLLSFISDSCPMTAATLRCNTRINVYISTPCPLLRPHQILLLS